MGLAHTNRLLFFATQPHGCSYLPDRLAVSVVADPRAELNPPLYGELLALGFRRSGGHVYAPHCPGCRACVPCRVPVAEFRPDRSQRRNARLNADVEVIPARPRYTDEYFELYARYLAARHPGGGMDGPTPESFVEFLIAPWCETFFAELRLDGRLVGVAVTDVVPGALSAVYTFYDPQLGAARGLGVQAVLWQIAEARRRGLPHLYLGYWIEDCAKMRYKRRYRPLEVLVEGGWRRLRSTAGAERRQQNAPP